MVTIMREINLRSRTTSLEGETFLLSADRKRPKASQSMRWAGPQGEAAPGWCNFLVTEVSPEENRSNFKSTSHLEPFLHKTLWRQWGKAVWEHGKSHFVSFIGAWGEKEQLAARCTNCLDQKVGGKLYNFKNKNIIYCIWEACKRKNLGFPPPPTSEGVRN